MPNLNQQQVYQICQMILHWQNFCRMWEKLQSVVGCIILCQMVWVKRKKGISFTYRFTGLESKNFSWYFNALIQEVMSIPRLSQGSVLKLHALEFIGLKLRDAASLYSRVDITATIISKQICCSSRVWTRLCGPWGMTYLTTPRSYLKNLGMALD